MSMQSKEPMTLCTAPCRDHAPEPDFAAVLRRRDFIKTLALFSAASSLAGRDLTSLLVAEVKAQATSTVGIFNLDLNLASLAALKNDFGSVRLKVSGMPSSFSNIVVTRVPGNQFFAVTSRCTHQGTTVNPYSTTLDAIRCPNHGSLYQPDGTVIQGPATQPLTSYKTAFDGASGLGVEIPGAGFSATIAGISANASGETRVRLEFPTVSNVKYDVRFRASIAGAAWTMVPFSTTADGPLDQSTLTGNGARATVFAAKAAELGFYAVVRTS